MREIMKTKQCVVCLMEYIPKLHDTNSKRCGSRNCRLIWKNKQYERTKKLKIFNPIKCQFCHKLFTPRNGLNKTCGDKECQKKRHKEAIDRICQRKKDSTIEKQKQWVKTCEICGVLYKPHHRAGGQQKRCSKECQKEASRIKAKKNRKDKDKKVYKNCRVCGIEFIASRKHKFRCSKHPHIRPKRTKKICKVCFRSFMGNKTMILCGRDQCKYIHKAAHGFKNPSRVPKSLHHWFLEDKKEFLARIKKHKENRFKGTELYKYDKDMFKILNRRRKSRKVDSSVYSNNVWKILRWTVLIAQPVCGIPNCKSPASQVDHLYNYWDIREFCQKDDLMGLCKYHHCIKSKAIDERMADYRKCKDRGDMDIANLLLEKVKRELEGLFSYLVFSKLINRNN